MKVRAYLIIASLMIFTLFVADAFSAEMEVFRGSRYMQKQISMIKMNLVLLSTGDVGIRARINSPKKEEYREICSRVSRIKYCNVRAYLDFYDEFYYDEGDSIIYWDETACAKVVNRGNWNQKIRLTESCGFKKERDGEQQVVSFWKREL